MQFPDRCVVCGGHADGKQVTLRGNPAGLHGMLPWLLGRTRRLSIPAHRSCGAPLKRRVLLRTLTTLLLTTAAVITGISLGLPAWQTVAAAALVAAVPVALQVVDPVAFEFTYRSGRYELELRDTSYAQELAELNDSEVS